jgi:protein-tyrosine phosphatase
LFAAGISAIVDVAANERPVELTRELSYCRFPLVDGPENESWLVRAAVDTTASLIRSRVPTLVCCSAGMSRSLVIAAAALAVAEGRPAHECLTLVTQSGGGDVSPGLWQQVGSLYSATAHSNRVAQ